MHGGSHDEDLPESGGDAGKKGRRFTQGHESGRKSRTDHRHFSGASCGADGTVPEVRDWAGQYARFPGAEDRQGSSRIAAEGTEHGDGKQSASHSGDFSYGGHLRSVHSGKHQLSIGCEPGRFVRPGAGEENRRNCVPPGGGVRHHADPGAGARYFAGFPHGTPVRAVWRRSDVGSGDGNGLCQGRSGNRDGWAASGVCGQAFSRVSRLGGRRARHRGKARTPGLGRNLRQTVPGSHHRGRTERDHALLLPDRWAAGVRFEKDSDRPSARRNGV